MTAGRSGAPPAGAARDPTGPRTTPDLSVVGQSGESHGAVDDPASRAQRLEHALRASGLRVSVEARASLAILVLAPDGHGLDSTARRECVRAALAAGFTHVAVEIAPSRNDEMESDDSAGFEARPDSRAP